ncbi:hypothetical protein, partial [Ruthenibacterium lactatiformans]|uniref:hypothetical protein n=1 Tax=Ruthenibacterium lactatiformans TaxID=1550024 RepID=UPI0026732FCC
ELFCAFGSYFFIFTLQCQIIYCGTAIMAGSKGFPPVSYFLQSFAEFKIKKIQAVCANTMAKLT